MALTAKLQFGDNQAGRYNTEYLLVDCHCSFRRSYNGLRPDGNGKCESIELSLVAPGRDDMTLYNWFINGDELSGRILFDLTSTAPDDANPTRILLFEEARCFSLQEFYDKDTRFRRLLKLAFESDSVTIEDTEFTNPE